MTDVIVARGRVDERWGPVVVVSLVAHAAVVTLLWLAPTGGASKDAPRTVMTISLGGSPGPRAGGMTPLGGRAVQQVAPITTAPRAESAPVPRAPKMALPTKEPRKARPRPTTSAARAEDSGQRPTTGDEVREGSARAETGARGQGFGLTGGGGGAGAGAYLDVGDFCCPEYLETVVQAIQRNWSAKQNVTGETLMKFTINRNGTLSGILVERPSGFAALDMAAQRALLSVERVPPLPAAFPNPTLTVHLRFEYQR